MSPVELLKVTQQCHTLRPSGDPSPRSAVSMVRLAVSRLFSTTTNGSRWRMVTSGLNATLLRDGIPHGVWFVAYDVCKNTLQSTFYSGKDFSMIGLFCGDRCAANYSHADDDAAASAPVPVAVSLTSGAVAATVAWAVGYPADLIKTRIQAATLHDTTVTTANTCDMNHKTKNGIIEIARQIIRESNGRVFAGLYRGFGLKLVRSIPASMVGFTVYEYVKEHLNALERRNRW